METKSKKGIYLVANLISQELCENLIFSIRETGCKLPIRVIHFGGEKINSEFILKQVEFLEVSDFPAEAMEIIELLGGILQCPRGFLHRFLAFYSDWDEFIYSDNDIIALSNWEKFFEYFPEYDVVHADEEYTTKGRFNYLLPQEIERIFGNGALETAITAGHFAVRNKPGMIDDFKKAIQWFKDNEHIPQLHDQALLHVASLLGKWKVQNLCKPPYNWLSSWAGDYKNPLKLIHALQKGDERVNISHIHYSGFSPSGDMPTDILLYSTLGEKEIIKKVTVAGIRHFTGISYCKTMMNKVKRKLKRMRKG